MTAAADTEVVITTAEYDAMHDCVVLVRQLAQWDCLHPSSTLKIADAPYWKRALDMAVARVSEVEA